MQGSESWLYLLFPLTPLTDDQPIITLVGETMDNGLEEPTNIFKMNENLATRAWARYCLAYQSLLAIISIIIT